MRRAGLIVVFGILLILSLSTAAADDTEAVVDDLSIEPQRNSALSYTSHGAISITSDSQFDIQAEAEGWAGGGNATHPYIIEGYEIAHDANNILISGVTRHFIIRNCLLTPDINPGINMGLYILASDNAHVENVTVTQKGGGYYLYDSLGIVVMESTADQCDEGFYIRYSHGAQLSDLEAWGCETGIYIGDSDDVTFDIGSIHDNDVGLFVENSDNLQMSKLVANDNTFEGIFMDTSNNCQLEDTTIYNCGDSQHAGFNCTNSNYFTATNITTWTITQGFWIQDSFQPTIEDSYFHDGWQTGIAIWGCSDVTIRRTQVESNMYYGIGLETVTTSLIENCESTYNQWEGIHVYNSPDCTIAHSEISNNGMAAPYPNVYASDSDNLLLLNNSISSSHNGDGVEIQFCDYTDLTQNTVDNNDLHGVLLWASQECTFDNNTMYLNGQDGIKLYGSHDALLNDQIVYNNSRWGIGLELSERVTITNCEVSFNVDHGIEIDSSNDTIVSYSRMYNNSFFGIRAWLSDRVEISHCDVYWNFYDGIFAQNSDYILVSYNDFWENGGGDCEITLDHASHAIISHNTLIGNRDTQGMYVTWSHHVTIEYNTIAGNVDDGLNIQNSNFTYIAGNNISYNRNSGIYLWECDFSTIIDNSIMRNNGAGIYIIACLNLTLSGNDIYENQNQGVYCQSSPNLKMEYNYVFDNGWLKPLNPASGIFIYLSDDCQLNYNIVFNNTQHGIQVDHSFDCVLSFNEVYGNLGQEPPFCGIYLYYADGTIISHNEIYDNSDHGIYSLYSGRCEILYNDIYSNNYTGILATQSVSWLIQGNQIWSQDYSIGIALQYSHYFIIDSNEIYNNPFGGIRFYLSNNCNFTNNFVYENAHLGVQIDACNDILVRGNIIFDNGGTGIRLFEANATWIYYNDLVANGGGDALELNSTGQNYWDDNVSMGNWWWEIARDLTNYTISNGTATVNFDRYPMTSMWIDDALAAGYEITTTGNSVIWSAYAHNPDYYEVYDGATLLGSGTWTGSDITFIIDGLSAGLHDLEIVIYHISGHTLTASVAVTVDDETAPTWVSTPTDQVIEYGQALSYQLLAADPSGIQSWAVNDTVHFSIVDGLLTNNGVLAPGSYGLQITVEDPYGNQLSVIITVTVRESLLGPMLLFVAAGGGIVLVVVIIIIAKKKQGT